MKLLSLFIFFSILINSQCLSQKKIHAYFELKKFYNIDKESYIEIFNKIDGTSIHYDQQNKNRLTIEYHISQNENSVSIHTDTITTFLKDSIANDITELKTFMLAPGIYNLKIYYSDLNLPNQKSVTQTSFEIRPLQETKPELSNIQVCESIYKTHQKNSFSKYGFDVIPYIGNYFSKDCNSLPIFYEIYNYNNDTNKYKINYQIIDLDKTILIQEISDSINYQFKKLNPFIKSIDISRIPSGRYSLSVCIKDKNNTQISKTNFEFDRLNNIETEKNSTTVVIDPDFQKSITSDSLNFYLKSLIPIVQNEDQRAILKLLKENDTVKIRSYFQQFWVITAKDRNIKELWLTYKSRVLTVEKLYKTNHIHGFETERGRVYLKYGPPSAINSRETSPSEYPYEIWQYDKIKTMSNKRFVFYNPDIVGNNYRLLHSDMVGEIKNYKWPGLLTKRNNSTTNVDDPYEGGFDHFGGESSDVYNQY